jgi:hypothetical protein
MRPRALIDLANYCRGFAVNLGHSKIDVNDIQKGIGAFSSDLVKDIGFEIRDVFPAAENVLYAFIDEHQTLPKDRLHLLLEQGGIPKGTIEPIVNILLWYGVLGVRKIDGSVVYIYNVNYEMAVLRGIIQKLQSDGIVFVVNPAFIPGLQMREDRL